MDVARLLTPAEGTGRQICRVVAVAMDSLFKVPNHVGQYFPVEGISYRFWSRV